MHSFYKIFTIVAFLMTSWIASAQGIAGSSSACDGVPETYSYTGTLGFGELASWSVSGGGTLGTCSSPCMSRDITFSGSGGTVTLQIKAGRGGSVLATYTKVVGLKNPVTTSNVNHDSRCGVGAVQLSISNPNGTYQWYTSSTGGSPLTTNLPAGITISGTGGSILSVNNLTSTKTYYAKEATCNTSRIPATATINTLPTQYSMTGGGGYCSGGSGLAIGLSDTQTGVNYQLKRGGTNVGSPVAGTNGAIGFGNQMTAGTYTVIATNTTT